MPDDEVKLPNLTPPVAELPPPPTFSEADDDELVMQQAAARTQQWKRERAALQAKVDELTAERDKLVEAAKDNKRDAEKKITFLELENIQLRNDIQTIRSDMARLQGECNQYRDFLSIQKKTLDAFGIKAPPKKARNGKKADAPPEGQASDSPPPEAKPVEENGHA